MATEAQTLRAIDGRMLLRMGQGATSDTILKLAEAWAAMRSPGEPYGRCATTWPSGVAAGSIPNCARPTTARS